MEVTEPRIISKAPPEELVVSADFIEAKDFVQTVKVTEGMILPQLQWKKHLTGYTDMYFYLFIFCWDIVPSQERYVDVRPLYFRTGKVSAHRMDY